MSFSTEGLSDGRTVFSFLSVITTEQGALILCNARAYSSEHLPLYCSMMRFFSTVSAGGVSWAGGVVDDGFSDFSRMSVRACRITGS